MKIFIGVNDLMAKVTFLFIAILFFYFRCDTALTLKSYK